MGGKPGIGFIGLGLVGHGLAKNILGKHRSSERLLSLPANRKLIFRSRPKKSKFGGWLGGGRFSREADVRLGVPRQTEGLAIGAIRS